MFRWRKTREAAMKRERIGCGPTEKLEEQRAQAMELRLLVILPLE